jgi:hypothetical protein
MWFMVSVVKGSKYFDSDSQIDNRIMISDTTEMVIAGYSTGPGAFRFEMRKGNECFIMQDMPKGLSKSELVERFTALAVQIGARINPVAAG